MRRSFPAEVLIHCGHHHVMPAVPVGVDMSNVLNHIRESSEVFIEREASLMIDRIRKTSDRLHDWQRAIALSVELSQPARFVSRGHQ
jgi:hypothetical protein